MIGSGDKGSRAVEKGRAARFCGSIEGMGVSTVRRRQRQYKCDGDAQHLRNRGNLFFADVRPGKWQEVLSHRQEGMIKGKPSRLREA